MIYYFFSGLFNSGVGVVINIPEYLKYKLNNLGNIGFKIIYIKMPNPLKNLKGQTKAKFL